MKSESVAVTVCPVEGLHAVANATAYEHHRWLLVSEEGRPVTAPADVLHEISLDLRFGYLVFRAPGMLRLDIPVDVVEDDPSIMETIAREGRAVRVVDEGVWAKEWFTRALGQPARLVKVLPEGD